MLESNKVVMDKIIETMVKRLDLTIKIIGRGTKYWWFCTYIYFWLYSKFLCSSSISPRILQCHLETYSKSLFLSIKINFDQFWSMYLQITTSISAHFSAHVTAHVTVHVTAHVTARSIRVWPWIDMSPTCHCDFVIKKDIFFLL